MKLPFLYTLATMGVAALTCLTILFLAGPPTVVAESNQKSPERRTTWMGALLEKAQSLNSSVKTPEDEPISDEDFAVEIAENKYDIVEEDKEFDYHGKPQFTSYESPTTIGGTASQNIGDVSTSRKSRGELLLRSSFANGSAGGNGGQPGIGGGAVIALAGQGNNGNSTYREKLINSLLESLDDDEIAELVENQKKRKNESKQP